MLQSRLGRTQDPEFYFLAYILETLSHKWTQRTNILVATVWEQIIGKQPNRPPGRPEKPLWHSQSYSIYSKTIYTNDQVNFIKTKIFWKQSLLTNITENVCRVQYHLFWKLPLLMILRREMMINYKLTSAWCVVTVGIEVFVDISPQTAIRALGHSFSN